MSKPTPTSSKPNPTPEKKKSGSKLTPRIHNRRAHYDYHILDKFECGIELVGSEVKSVRKGHVQLSQSFARIKGNQVFLEGCHIDEYTEANQFNHEATRTRRLLLHRREIRRLIQRLQKEQSATLIPLEIYFQRGYAKVLLGLAKGKKAFDKRQTIREREDKRNMDKALRHR
jgi:SsrA-binding protein